MSELPWRRALRAAALLLVLAGGLWLADAWRGGGPDDPQASIALLVEDGIRADDPRVTIWTDAAREEGLHLQVVSASDFLRPRAQASTDSYAGIILPDGIARNAGLPLVERLTEFVAAGGQLMPVYDAATYTPSGVYYAERAPLSVLVGVDYALYDSLRGNTGAADFVWGGRATMRALGVPPGKSLPEPNLRAPARLVEPEVMVGYQYGLLRYSSFVTRGNYEGEPLLRSSAGSLIAGYRTHGKGGVLFVNLPLGHLKGQTDGLLLHGFLRYFADAVVRLPLLSAAPNGRGGLVFNWHVDSNAAIKPMDDLEHLGLLQQGPFSIHFTAGPDARAPGDGLGLDLARNATMQTWAKRFKQRGDALGNHGGWIHDHFGLNVSESNRAQMEPYLQKNDEVVTALNGAPVREYSAPVGNQPKWVTEWLERRGYVAYYFMGNSGMTPTRSYREGRLYTPKIWSFPVLTFGKIASFEEADEEEMPETRITAWLKAVSDHAAERGTIHTFYSHPPGFRHYPGVFKNWFSHTADLLGKQQFAWYTMTEIGDFLNRRERTVWNVRQSGERLLVEAEHPEDLDRLTWKFSKAAYARPVLEKGSGTVIENDKYWLVIAKPGRILGIATTRLSQGGTR